MFVFFEFNPKTSPDNHFLKRAHECLRIAQQELAQGKDAETSLNAVRFYAEMYGLESMQEDFETTDPKICMAAQIYGLDAASIDLEMFDWIGGGSTFNRFQRFFHAAKSQMAVGCVDRGAIEIAREAAGALGGLENVGITEEKWECALKEPFAPLRPSCKWRVSHFIFTFET